MRNVFIIAYDIGDPKRYRQIYKSMCGAGDSLQYSVFRCELSAVELQQLKSALWPKLNLAEDRVMIIDLGPTEGRGDDCIDFWGDPRVTPSDRTAIVL